MAEMSTPEFIVAEAEKAFKQEFDAIAQLTTKAEKYLAAAAVILGLKIIEQLSKPQGATASPIVTLAVVIILFSMLIALMSIRVQGYSTYPPERHLYEALEKLSVDDARLAAARLYLDARSDNRQINRNRARALVWSGWLLLSGFAIIVILYLVA